MEKPCVISYDLGTGSVKASLVDTEGVILGTEMESYPLYTPQESWAEQDPEDYWRGVCVATKRVIQQTQTDPHDVKGVVFGTQWKGIIPLDKDHHVLHNSIVWLDARANQQAKSMNRVMQLNYYKEKLFPSKPSSKLNAALGKNILCGSDYWPKLMWLRENLPDVYEKTAIILECNSYVKWRATNVMAVDMTNHFVRSFSKSTQATYDLIMKLTKVNTALFPDIVLPTDTVGTITEKASEEIGLPIGTPVFGGCGDIPAIAIGSGCSDLGDTHVYFGSSGWLASVVSCSEGFLSTSPFSKEYDLLLIGLQSIGLSFDWTIRQLYHQEYKEKGAGIYNYLDEELADIPAGSLGLLATSWIYGERPPFFSDKARGLFININSQHDRRHMLNAMMESVCYSMRMALDALREGTNREVKEIHAAGGGACNDHWMQMLADIMGIPVIVPQYPRHAGAIGTAYCALIGLGLCKDFDEAKARIKTGKTFLPREENSAIYDKMLNAYRKLYSRSKSTFADLA